MARWVMRTYNGHTIDFENGTVDVVDVKDIARSLSMQARFIGHTAHFYSVAQHCVFVSKKVDPRYAMAGLFHDASEAYLGDVIRPVRKLITGYDELEASFMQCIADALDFEWPLPSCVEEADNRTGVTEFYSDRVYQQNPEGIDIYIGASDIVRPYQNPYIIPYATPAIAEFHFLERYKHIQSTKFKREVGLLP